MAIPLDSLRVVDFLNSEKQTVEVYTALCTGFTITREPFGKFFKYTAYNRVEFCTSGGKKEFSNIEALRRNLSTR